MTNAGGRLTRGVAFEALRNFFREKPLVFLGSGMSCALDDRFSMQELAKVLIDKVPPLLVSAQEKKEWYAVADALRKGRDLESAMGSVLDQSLVERITETAGGFISEVSCDCCLKVIEGRSEWPAGALLKVLVDTLPAADPVLNVVTPNYDLVMEHACEHLGVPYTNGFSGGLVRTINWPASEQSMWMSTRKLFANRLRYSYMVRKHIRLHKVHGSINYFTFGAKVIENNEWIIDPPAFVQRVMITPGVSKHEKLQMYRQELLQRADEAIERESRFLFLGYGFNDVHLEQYIRRKLIDQASYGLIITRDSNPRIQTILDAAANLWLVCRGTGSLPKTTISNCQYPRSLCLDNSLLWDVAEFKRQILGG
ncbi:MAG: SIR2 family protein [Chloroflexi bacterium]|nr:SIR2 family protein [Chloroflexota bacterium]